MAGEVSAILQLAVYTCKAGRAIQSFAKDVKEHDLKIIEAGKTIEQHGRILQSMHFAYEMVKGERDPGIQNSARNFRDLISKTEEALESLTRIHRSWGGHNQKVLHRALNQWFFQEGGKEEFEGMVSKIEKLKNDIQLEVSFITIQRIFLNKTLQDTPQTENESIFSDSQTLYDSGTEVEDDPVDPLSLSPALIDAINEGIPRDVKARLRAGDLVLAFDKFQCNALHYAVKAGGRRVLAELLKSGELQKDPNGMNYKYKDGETPLHLALRLGNKVMMAELLSAEASADVKDKYDSTCLEKALRANNSTMVELLLKHKANETLLAHDGVVDPLLSKRLTQMKQIMKLRSRS